MTPDSLSPRSSQSPASILTVCIPASIRCDEIGPECLPLLPPLNLCPTLTRCFGHPRSCSRTDGASNSSAGTAAYFSVFPATPENSVDTRMFLRAAAPPGWLRAPRASLGLVMDSRFTCWGAVVHGKFPTWAGEREAQDAAAVADRLDDPAMRI